jgi:hypothetical protein
MNWVFLSIDRKIIWDLPMNCSPLLTLLPLLLYLNRDLIKVFGKKQVSIERDYWIHKECHECGGG